jgi:hypothetical protein
MKIIFKIISPFIMLLFFFIVSAQTVNAACAPPYTGYVGWFSDYYVCLISDATICIWDNIGGYNGFTGTNVGNPCAGNANSCGSTAGTCDDQGTCVVPACMPDCNTTPSNCSACNAQPNTCDTNNGTQDCTLTGYTGGGTCNQKPITMSCTINNCSSGYTCDLTYGFCVAIPTPTPIPAQICTPNSFRYVCSYTKCN